MDSSKRTSDRLRQPREALVFGVAAIVAGATWLALGANVLLLYWRGYWKTGHAGAAFWAACIGFALMTVNSGPRTIIVAYLALSAELAILEALERGKTRAAWLLPPLFSVWINLHGSWLIGLGLLVLYILCGAFSFSKGVFEQPARAQGRVQAQERQGQAPLIPARKPRAKGK